MNLCKNQSVTWVYKWSSLKVFLRAKSQALSNCRNGLTTRPGAGFTNPLAFILSNTKVKRSLRNSPVGKGICHGAWRPEFSSLYIHGEEREKYSYLLSFFVLPPIYCVLLCQHMNKPMCTHIHNEILNSY